MDRLHSWVAIIDDDESIRLAMQRLLGLAGIDAIAFPGGAEFFGANLFCEPACVVLDIHMPEMSGFDVHRSLCQVFPGAQVIFLTGYDTPETRQRALNRNPLVYLHKTVGTAALLNAIKLALTNYIPRSKHPISR